MPYDPICRMIVSDESPYRVKHKGSLLYFCSPACKKVFLKRRRELESPVLIHFFHKRESQHAHV